ncbi:hypothetical protein [Streptomyces sp. NPDC126514]|uniref:hypothetical protein n=1 Tax=Streptomyces sp. NPDC126514 TaxID=3155210 RepID=UPI003332BC10
MSRIPTRHLLVGLTVCVALGALGLAVATSRVTADHAGVIAAAASLIAAAASWAATSRASDTAAALAAIEHDRWHAEMTPDLEVSVSYPSWGAQRALFRIVLVGPPTLRELESVVVTIRDDEIERRPVVPPPPSAEDIANQIWGPMRFIAGIDGVEGSGRTTPSFRLVPGTAKRFDMDRTVPPSWDASSDPWGFWNLVHGIDKPVRLWIECRASGFRPWYLHREVSISTPSTRGDDARPPTG